MAKITRQGNAAPSGPVPAGLKGKCYRCGTLFETEENEPEATPTVDSDGIPGWHIPCPAPYCPNIVFVRSKQGEGYRA